MAIKKQDLIREDCERVYSQAQDKFKGLSNSSILVTGGSGFLGCWVIEFIHYLNKYQNMNIEIFCLDRNTENIEMHLNHIKDQKNFNLIQSDIRGITDLPGDINYIIHGASSPDTRAHSSNPIDVMTSIAGGTASILHSANRLSKLVKFVNVSSSAVYDEGTDLSISEDSPGLSLELKSNNAHSEAKRYAEMLCTAARSEARMPVTSIRPFTFCGAFQAMDSPWALNNFINDVFSKRPIRILGDGNTIRSYMYGADLAAWVLIIMNNSKNGTVYNVGSNTGYTLSEIAEKVSKNSNNSSEIILNSSLTGSLANRSLVPNTDKAEKELGLSQYTDIDTAIERTMAWYKTIN